MNRLVRFGAEALKPQKIAGAHKWRTPKVSRRKANVLRKKALRDGSFGSVVIDAGTPEVECVSYECWGTQTPRRCCCGFHPKGAVCGEESRTPLNRNTQCSTPPHAHVEGDRLKFGGTA